MASYLKFADKAAFEVAFGPYMIDGVPKPYIGTSAVDVVGVIWKPTGKMLTTEFSEFPEMKPIDGFHVNLSGEVPDDLKAFEIPAPATPSRVFA